MNTELMTLQEVADFLRLSKKTIERRIKDRTIIVYMVGPTARFRRDEIEALAGGGK